MIRYKKVWRKLKNIYHLISAFVASCFYGFPARSLTVLAVTGTDGKTTTTNLIHWILKKTGYQAGMTSTVGAKFGKLRLDTGLHTTTPNSWWLQKVMRQMVKNGITHLVIEATAHGIDQHRLFGTNIKIAVFTNVTHEHLDYFGHFQRYLKTKSKLIKRAKLALVNQDDQSFKFFKKTAQKGSTQLISYGQTPKASVYPKKVKYQENQISFKLKNTDFKLPLNGEFNLYNGLAAIQAVNSLGISYSKISQALKTFPGVLGRLDVIKTPWGFKCFVDFAHTPNALKNAILAIKKLKSQTGRVVAVFGATGGRDPSKRPIMGEVAARLADIIILTTEDPRFENPSQVISQIAQGCLRGGATEVESLDSIEKYPVFIRVVDRQKAINKAVLTAQKGDVVGAFGKGHETTMPVKGKEVPWSDHQAIKKAIKRRQE